MSSAYTTLTTFFHTHRTTAAQISILPSSSPSILISTPHLGIPKQCLISAFTHARTVFSSADDDPTTLLDATTILILAASEHLTAVNTRKRLLLSSHHSPSEELVLLESFLTSPLPCHNKSPLLWAHRKWVVATFALEPGLCQELEVVQKSADVHPRNYYAWDYARRAVIARGEVVGEETVEMHLRFCWRHAADVGVWMFLGFLLERVRDGVVVERVLEEVMRFCDVAPGHEGLWCFVRTFIGKLMEPEARGRLVGMLEGWVGEEVVGEEREREKRLEERALRWIKRFGIKE
ncbi:hypothetical protein K440DRAFT_659522 [Wilcoxina mikolae CBS 423.85]|nr:hypothetical protein K440DRAFT_659522 [Wilcoxina mikolae CBS 423.85]